MLATASPLAPYDAYGRGHGFWTDFNAFNARYAAYLEQLLGCPSNEFEWTVEDCDPRRGVDDIELWLGVDGAARRLFELK